MTAAIPPVSFGRYVLLEKIAVGGMAEIFKAQYSADKDFEKVLVIKRILPNLASNEEFISMFRDEAKVNVRLTHANIVQVFDFGREGNDYYLAMEYVQGQNLRRVMKRAGEIGTGALPIPMALYVAQETAKGLGYAHTRKDAANKDLDIIHRDVTPSNILVSYEGEVKITDFGIAKAASKTNSTQQGMVKGKAPYLAPEQLQPSMTPDARLDVFALGAVTWEMLTGRRLVPGETDMEVLGCLMNGGAFPKPSELKSTISPEVDRVVMKALERKPDDRYPTAAAYQKELAALVSRFAMTSSEATTFMKRLFATEIEAEVSSSNVVMPVVDAGMVRQGAEQESTRTRQSKPDPYARTGGVPETGAGLEDTGARQLRGAKKPDARELAATKFVSTPSQPLAVPTSPPPAPAPRGLALPLVGVGTFAAIAIALVVAQPWKIAEPPPPSPTPTPVVIATATATATLAATPEATPESTPVVVIGTPAPTPTKPPRSTMASRPTPQPSKVALATPVPTAPVVAGTGVLSVDSTPSGKIYIDGKDTGRETPAFNVKVPAGKHTIRIVNEISRAEAVFAVEIAPNQTMKKSVTLVPRN